MAVVSGIFKGKRQYGVLAFAMYVGVVRRPSRHEAVVYLENGLT